MQSPDERDTEQSSVGSPTEGDRVGGNAYQTDGGERGTDGTDESGRYDELGSLDEQHQELSTGNRESTGNIRLEYYDRSNEDKSLPFFGKITDEVRLLGRENISTDEQLFSYKTSLEEQMKNLIAGRTHLRKKIRTNIDDGQLQTAKDEIASINGELKKLRREVKLCEDIAERSKVMEENLEHIETEEQKQQRKEKSRYEQRW